MYRDTNREILAEINRLGSVSVGRIPIGRSERGTTTVSSLGSFYSAVLGQTAYVALKEYAESSREKDDLELRVACELGVIDLIEKNLPQLISEVPRFHGVLLDAQGKPVGVITEDYSRGGTAPVRDRIADLPYDLQKLMGKPKYPKDLETACFLVDEKRRIGDFGVFTEGTSDEKSRLSGDYIDRMDAYTVRVMLEGR